MVWLIVNWEMIKVPRVGSVVKEETRRSRVKNVYWQAGPWIELYTHNVIAARSLGRREARRR